MASGTTQCPSTRARIQSFMATGSRFKVGLALGVGLTLACLAIALLLRTRYSSIDTLLVVPMLAAALWSLRAMLLTYALVLATAVGFFYTHNAFLIPLRVADTESLVVQSIAALGIGVLLHLTRQRQDWLSAAARDMAAQRDAQVAGAVALAAENARLFIEADRERARLRAILASVSDTVVLFDTDGRVVDVMSGPTPIPTVTQATMSGKTDAAILDEANHTVHHLDGSPFLIEESPARHALRGEVVRNNVVVVDQPGGQVYISGSAAPIYAADGSIVGAVMVSRDVSNVFQENRQRDEFLSVATHELKTPLTAARGQVELAQMRLRAAPSDLEPIIGNLAIALRMIDNLVVMIDDLLDVSRIQAGQLTLRLRSVDLTMLLREVLTTLHPIVADHDVQVEGDEALPHVWADPQRISQVITNLITNATRYSAPHTPITITLHHTLEEVVLRISDQGIGIPTEEQERLFTRFFRSSNARRQSRGLGLGLFVSRTIAIEHHGQLDLEASSPTGSTFCLRLPRAAPVDN